MFFKNMIFFVLNANLFIYKKNFLFVVISKENRKFPEKNLLFVIILEENHIIKHLHI